MTPTLVLICLILAQAPRPEGVNAPDSPAPPPSAAAVVTSLESAMVQAIARAESSVVAIHRDKAPNVTETRAVRGWKPPVEEPRPRPRSRTSDADDGDFISFDYGSGVVIGDHGEILTAFHVVRGAIALVVHAAGGQAFRAEIIAADPRGDLAVIVPVVEPGAEAPHLRPIAIGDSSRLRKGSFVIALGNPFNAARHDGSASASWGIVSNFARRLDARVDPRSGRSVPTMLQEFPTLLQLDARLNLGMSGGAVLNLKGELVGLTTTASSPAGFDAQAGYAIPMDATSRRAIERLRRGEEVEYGLLGIVPDETRSNRIFQVSANSPAARGDLQVDDEIIAVNGVPVTDFHSLIVAVNVYGPGEAVKVKVRRGSATLERTIVLDKFPVQGEIIATTRPRPWRGIRVDYTSSRGLTNGLADLGITPGVIVTEVEPGSPADAAGLRKDVVINKVDGRSILNPRQFAEAVAGRDDPVELETNVGPRTVKPKSDASARSPSPSPGPGPSRTVLDR